MDCDCERNHFQITHCASCEGSVERVWQSSVAKASRSHANIYSDTFNPVVCPTANQVTDEVGLTTS